MKKSRFIFLLLIMFMCSLLIPAFTNTSEAAKTLRVASLGGVRDAGRLSPYQTGGSQDVAILPWVFNCLFRFPLGSLNLELIEPDLLEKWESSKDNLVWTFYLKKGVQFHQGFGEMTSEDVIYSLNWAKDKKSSRWWQDFSEFEKIEALDRYTVKITLSKSIPSVLGVLANVGGSIICKKAYEERGEDAIMKPLGTGPFEFVEYQPQRHIKFKAHEKYFRGRPKIDEVIYRYMPDSKSRQLAFKKGELDMMFAEREQEWIDEVKKSPDAIVDIIMPGEMRTLHFNLTRKPLDNPKVRQALAHAINRQEFLDYHGKDITLPAVSPLPPGYMGHTDAVALYPYNPEKAKKLLAEAGFPNGCDLGTMKTSSLGAYEKPMTIVQAQFNRVGVRLNLETVDHATYHKLIRQNVNPVVLYGAARFPNGDQYLSQFYHSAAVIGTPTAVTNFSHYGKAIPGVDEYIEKARTSIEPKEQIKYWEMAQKQIMEDLPAYPLFVLKNAGARKNYVKLGHVLESSLTTFYYLNEMTDIVK